MSGGASVGASVGGASVGGIAVVGDTVVGADVVGAAAVVAGGRVVDAPAVVGTTDVDAASVVIGAEPPEPGTLTELSSDGVLSPPVTASVMPTPATTATAAAPTIHHVRLRLGGGSSRKAAGIGVAAGLSRAGGTQRCGVVPDAAAPTVGNSSVAGGSSAPIDVVTAVPSTFGSVAVPAVGSTPVTPVTPADTAGDAVDAVVGSTGRPSPAGAPTPGGPTTGGGSIARPPAAT